MFMNSRLSSRRTAAGRSASRGFMLLEVLVALAKGSSPSAIAESLAVSPSTVSTHLRAIKTKLAVDSLAALVQQAIKAGLLD